VLNRTTTLSDGEVERVASALQTQVRRDLAPVWGVDAEIVVVKRGEAAAPGHWWLELLDEGDMPGALGYHDVTPDGLPKAKVFTKLAKDIAATWTVTASHELLNMLVDPRANLVVIAETRAEMRAHAVEIATPCQDDSYFINGVAVSDFVFPAWYEPARPRDSTQFDFLRLIHQSLELRPGGYSQVIGPDFRKGWTVLFDESPRGK
jgi:hypothetical protein